MQGFHEMAKSFVQNLPILAHETQWVLHGFAQNRKYFLLKLRMKQNFSFAQFKTASFTQNVTF